MKRRNPTVPTRERILDETERLIASKGVIGFRLLDVARPLKLRVPAIYKHYISRDDVLVAVARRFIELLAEQFTIPPAPYKPERVLRTAMNRFVEFELSHPAYVRLTLIDLATPEGGMEYVKRAAGGSFEDNFASGPLAPLHERLRSLLNAGARGGVFRRVEALDFYRVVKSALLMRLVFPHDLLLLQRPSPKEVRVVQRWLWDVARGYLALRS